MLQIKQVKIKSKTSINRFYFSLIEERYLWTYADYNSIYILIEKGRTDESTSKKYY